MNKPGRSVCHSIEKIVKSSAWFSVYYSAYYKVMEHISNHVGVEHSGLYSVNDSVLNSVYDFFMEVNKNE